VLTLKDDGKNAHSFLFAGLPVSLFKHQSQTLGKRIWVPFHAVRSAERVSLWPIKNYRCLLQKLLTHILKNEWRNVARIFWAVSILPEEKTLVRCAVNFTG